MRFYEYGEKDKPVIVMLGGSFCPAGAMEYLYSELSRDHHVIVPEYNGHYEGSEFSTRQGEAAEVRQYLRSKGIDKISMVYGQSMGCEVGMELVSQLLAEGIEVGSAFFDGAPMIKLSRAYKAFMYFKFRTFIKMMRTKSVDEVIGWKFLDKFTAGDTESMHPMIQALADIAPVITDRSIKNENECCYTFDFPGLSEDMQKRVHFFYARAEKAYKTCIRGVKKAYPHAEYTVVDGCGHLSYSVKNTEKYLEMLRETCGA